MYTARVGDKFTDDRDGGTFEVFEVDDKHFRIKCVVSDSRWEVGSTYKYTHNEIEVWHRNWRFIPGKENNIKKLLEAVDEQD